MSKTSLKENRAEGAETRHPGFPGLREESGVAMLVVMIALAILTAFSAYLSLSSVEELRISDNSESMVQARFAGRAGIEHARELCRGLMFDEILKGPDGAYTNTSDYLTTARSVGFRNLASLQTFRALDITDPSTSLSALPDDGLINTGMSGGVAGTELIPKYGNLFTVANPYGSGNLVLARYFVKVTDNNGEASEIARDAADNPFHDGDGTVIVRSIGVARTIGDGNGADARRNSVVVYESRFRQGLPFGNLGSPAVVIGSKISANFSGNAFDIIGNSAGPGIGTIDTDRGDGYSPSEILKTATKGKGNITGNCTGSSARQCIADITDSVDADPSKAMLKDPEWLYEFAYNESRAMADYRISDNNNNNDTTDLTSAMVGSRSNPKVTWIGGNCKAAGNITGAGLLVVTGELTINGAVRWDGLILVIGKGSFRTGGMNNGIYGGLIVAGVKKTGNVYAFDEVQTDFDIRGNSQIATYDGALANMGNGLAPLRQIAFREILGGMDP
ncbi:MAG: hypothetical protein QM330_09595 [Acidobacteriota bacterium]|jgi:hypothetical protein|nr:hypothetical protein [Acidobacteriota bacterium]NLT33306.1 hypothetical protein [Acidobacteriota bacterium]